MKRFLIPLWSAALVRAQELDVMKEAPTIEVIRHDHGLSLALAGMLIVFAGLLSISLFIALLPHVMALLKRLPFPSSSHGHGHDVSAPTVPPAADVLDNEILAAIAMVLHSETERMAGQDPKVTIGLSPSSPWALSSNMRIIPGRIKTS